MESVIADSGFIIKPIGIRSTSLLSLVSARCGFQDGQSRLLKQMQWAVMNSLRYRVFAV